MHRVLIATEGASCSPEAMLQYARTFRPEDVTIFILAVIPSVGPMAHGQCDGKYYQWESEEALIALDRAASSLEKAGYTSFSLIRVGDASECTLCVARELDADTIVLGPHGGRGIKRLIRESVVESILRRATCEVVVTSGEEGPHAPEDHPAA